ncbi:hypothetical protein, partial [Nocardia cyriacigeorgica]|uniref:hypothetical protein n=1 Tax=Nocardia cyriacigeorgica TaxID=135487 RepID=UPI0024563C01
MVPAGDKDVAPAHDACTADESEAAEHVLDAPGLADDDGNPFPDALVGMVRDDTVRKGSAAQADLPA